MRTAHLAVGALLAGAAVLSAQSPKAAPKDDAPLLGILAKENEYSVANLKTADGTKAYYLAYTVTDTASLSIGARLGALQGNDNTRARILDVDLRVGDHALDNTRQIRGGRGGGFGGAFAGGASTVALDDDPAAIRQALWRATNDSFTSAVERYQRVLTNNKTQVKEENPADDFSHEEPSVFSEPDVKLAIDRDAWVKRVKAVSAMALKEPKIESSSVSVVGTAENRYLVSNEGTRLKTGRKLLRVVVSASAKAEDGMDISQSFLFNAATEDHLPGEEEMRKAMGNVMKEVLALRSAPLVEPYTGPAILMNRASGVFFHEIFGHRIEGHRQKSEDEGQTFTKMVGQPVLPEFLSVIDDPTLPRYGNEDLRGFYRFDDEGVPAQRVSLVKNGVLETFLLSRSPLTGFAKSNGHGRREPGRDAVSRQGNLMVVSTKAMPFAQLRAKLIELCKKQEKPFGLLFEDITGGFTTTTRGGPQAFKVQPVVVYRIYADGRPDELVRGVDIVGTPLSCFSKIVATADDTAVFNGTCGAESGWVPVTATSPSILVEQIEIEKKARSSERPPLLASPVAEPPARPADAAAEPDPKGTGLAADPNTMIRALDVELARRGDLKLPGIEAPYYLEYRVVDRKGHAMSATQGALVRSEPSRNRSLRTDVRVGSYELDNTNFGGGGGAGGPGGFGGGRRPGGGGGGFGGGGAVALPIEDDITAIRQAAWLATDSAYKAAVETFTQKKAFLDGRAQPEQRPADFAKAEIVKSLGSSTTLDFDASAWEGRVRKISGAFRKHKNVIDSGVELSTVADTETFVTTEGTRERFGSKRATLVLHAEVQAADGEHLTDRIVHVAETAADLPNETQLLAEVDELAARLTKIAEGSRIKEYSGPILFDGVAAPQLFQAMVARGVAAQPPTPGGGRRGPAGESLDKLFGKRILPASFHVWDDPTTTKANDTFLAGSYAFDDEGIAPQKVELVTGGKFVGFVSSRVPNETIAASNGHGRGGRATIGCMFVEAADGLADAALKEKLIAVAKDQNLKFGLRVSSFAGAPSAAAVMRRFAAGRGGRGGGAGAAAGGGRQGGALPEPLVVTKVFVEDGHEEAIRGCEFDAVTVAALKDIVAAGKSPIVWNTTGAAATSVIAPAVILETVNVFGVEAEAEKKPPLLAPSAR